MTAIIGLASGLGGRHPGAEEGPVRILETLLPEHTRKTMIVSGRENMAKVEHIARLNEELAEETRRAITEGLFPLVLGGDHSSGIGTWSGVATGLERDMGLLWLDAHMDCHTFESSETGNIHGMPVAALLGEGSCSFTEILSKTPKVKPENLFLIGIRSYEAAEQERAQRLGVRVYYMEEVKIRGLRAIFSEIRQNFAARNIPFGISLDIDFFDPEKMTATGTPEAGGVIPEEFLDAYAEFGSYPPIAFEFVEFNPLLDDGQSLPRIGIILRRVAEGIRLQNFGKKGEEEG